MSEKLSQPQINIFRRTIYSYYKKYGRILPWRQTHDPYKIIVSEIMLQQTQVDRVIPKYERWIKIFPDFLTLAKAPLKKILKEWRGLGYNRRAINLKRLAEIIVRAYINTPLPNDPKILETLPGIGPHTAGSIAAFAFNQPVTFIETNIRTVFIHYFFQSGRANSPLEGGSGGVRLLRGRLSNGSQRKGLTPPGEPPSRGDLVSDADIMPLVEQTLDRKDPRRWYNALMDYGVYLKKLHKNPSRRSAHYIKQSKFEGSNRQLRGMILKCLVTHRKMTIREITSEISGDKEMVEKNLQQLTAEGFLKITGKKYQLS